MEMDLVSTNISFNPFRIEALIDDCTATLLYNGIYECLELIKNGETHKLSFEFLYRTCYRLTINNYGGMLYGGVLYFITEMLDNKKECESTFEIINFWKNFEITMDTLHNVLMYLEKNFISSNTKVPIKTTGMAIFMKHYLFSNGRFESIMNYTLEQINISRKSRELDICVSKDIKFIVEQILSLPPIEINIKLLPMDTIDSIKLNETYCHHSNIEGNEFISFKSRIPIDGTQDNRILVFTYKFNQDVAMLDWRNSTIFNQFFMPPFLNESQNYHKNESLVAHTLNSNSILHIRSYLSRCENTYLFEKSLVEHFLVFQVWEELIREMDKIWIHPFFEKFQNKTIFEFFSIGNKNDLQQMFRILSRVPECLEKLKGLLKQFFSTCLDKILPLNEIFNDMRFNCFINEIKSFKNRSEFIFIECFNNNSMFNQVINLSFEDFFLSRDAAAIINWIVAGFDIVLRSLHISNETDANSEHLEILFWIFKHISNKNLFEIKYRASLCKRIMEFTAKKKNVEHEIIMRLRGECGNGYTMKMEGILTDILQSEILNKEFHQAFKNEEADVASSIINYNILTPNFWIINPIMSLSLINELHCKLNNFTQFFHSKYDRRKLQWHFGAGTATINVRGKQCESFIIECSTIQMLILDIFNTFDYISFEEMQKTIGCSDVNFLKNNLISLIFENEVSLLIVVPINIWRKEKINHDNLSENKGIFEFSDLNIDPKDYYSSKNPILTSISPSDIICINNNISVKESITLKYGCLDCKTDAQQMLESESSTIQDKGHIIDSIIVKILKKSRTLHIEDITKRVINHNNILFQGSKELITERLEILCQKEFVSKDLCSQNLYSYVP
ncbi:cullin domain-containing protein [Cryptosporidium canis]|uniref:Cullin domain-containing protein n=1 Tax=Cryptosporidium canis TaxID=195482 RepID=A0ABQ8P688_9CRYT|nr:cullin domain-containing protein [Cryptosporidium canis]